MFKEHGDRFSPAFNKLKVKLIIWQGFSTMRTTQLV